MMNDDTLDRKKVINNLNCNQLVQASAGSGKTTILVERMVAMVESGQFDISKMAALTFTKKAAGEFYERFYKKLQLRIKDGFKKEKDDKFSLLNDPTDEGKARDKKALKEIDTCFFGTIDSFYQKILNEHPMEAQIPSSSKVLDDNEFKMFLIAKFSEYLKSDNEEIRKGAELFAELVGASNFPNLMRLTLSNRTINLYQLPYDATAQLENYKKSLQTFKKGIKIIFDNREVLRIYKNKPNEDGEFEDATKDSKKAWEYLINNINGLLNLDENDLKSGLFKLKGVSSLRFRNDTDLFTNCNSFITNADIVVCDDKYYEIQCKITDFLKKYIYITTINFLKMTVGDVRESLIKNCSLTFSEATLCLLTMLRNDKEYKDAINQIRNKYDCLLIDECQDTDINQYEIFFRIAGNNYPKDFKDMDISGGKLFIVGDRKQSIYRFRGADVKTFDFIKEIFEKHQSNNEPYELITLTNNWRSKGKLCRYYNDTFTRLLGDGFSPIPNDTIKKGEEDFGAYFYKSSKDDDGERVANLILKLIELKNYSFKDFMIMTSNKDNITTYAAALAEHNIPCYCEGKINFDLSSLLTTVVSLFKYFASKKTDTISYLEILSSELFNFDITKSIDMDEDYLSILSIDETSLYPSELLENLLSNKQILKSLNCNGVDIIIALIHLIKIEEDSGNINSFDDAVKYIDSVRNKEIEIERISLLSGDVNAVQIANAHKTKGLEKKVVILTKAGTSNKLPSEFKTQENVFIANVSSTTGNYSVLENTDCGIEGTESYIAQQNENAYLKEETKRLLYVAATRAREYLFVNQAINSKNKIMPSKWKELVDEKMKEEVIDCTKLTPIQYEEIDLDDEYKKYSSPLDNNKEKVNKITYNVITPSKLESNNKFDEEKTYDKVSIKDEDSLIFGTMVHKLMEYIVNAKNKVLDKNICRYIANIYNANHLVERLDDVRKVIYGGGYLDQPECPFSDIVEFIKDKDCYTEIPYSYMQDNSINNGQIDLLIVKDNKAIIIDYKTDKNTVDHTAQLNAYVSAVKNSELLKDKEVSCYIYHIYKE